MSTSKYAERTRKKTPRLIAFIVGLVFSISLVTAQTGSAISGRVVDEKGEAVIGATVTAAKKTVITDVDGNFSIDTPVGSVIEITYIGFKPYKQKIESDKFLTIMLQEDNVMLDEMVVVAYGTQKKESLTGAISNIKSEDIIKTKAPSLGQAIQGKVAGLRIRQEDGEPGQFRSSINVRGLGEPLFIIDGIVRDGAAAFQKLNPDDIESISFLKDGTAAIYGMNSSNGAVIVTTKKGKQGKTRISLSANMGIAKPTAIPTMANAAQYQEMRNDAAIYASGTPYITQEELALWQQGGAGYQSTNFTDEVFKKSSLQQQYNISLSGGSDVVTYFTSFGYSRDESLLKSGDLNYDKYSIRSNLEIQVIKGLTAGINLAGSLDETNQPWDSFFEIYKQTRVNVPTKPLYANNNRNYLATQTMGTNPLALADADIAGYHIYNNKNFQSTFSLKYELPFVKGLSVRGQFGYDYALYKHTGLKKKYSTYAYSPEKDTYIESIYNSPTSLGKNSDDAQRIDFQAQVDYSRTFDEKHSVSGAFIYERKQERNESFGASRNFDLFSFPELNYAGSKDQQINGFSNKRAFISYIGRLNYGYMGKYLAEFGFRYDGSYRYARNSRWAFAPTGSLGWRISEEKFIKDKFKFVDNLKFRASYGKSARDTGKEFQYLSGYNLNTGIYEFTDGTALAGIAAPSIANPKFTWMETEMFDLGLDLSIFNGLGSLEFDVYRRKQSGIKTTRVSSLPNTFGGDLPEENLNKDITEGIEFTIGHRNKIGQVSYSVKGNMNLARTKMDYVERSPFISSWDRWRNQSAGRWNDFVWGLQTDGRFTNAEEIRHYNIVQLGENGNAKELPGDYKFQDTNGDGLIDDNDRMPLYWNSTPLIHYGLSLEASWNNFDIYALFQGAAMYSVQFRELYAEILWSKGSNTPAYFYDRWHQENPYDPDSRWIAGNWPASRLGENVGALYTENTNIWRKDASYLRLKSVELGYTLPKTITDKMGIGNVRFYINGYNLLTFADSFVKIFDPEKIEGNYSAGLNYPLTKTYNFGFTANF